jgi:hypothetical protein
MSAVISSSDFIHIYNIDYSALSLFIRLISISYSALLSSVVYMPVFIMIKFTEEKHLFKRFKALLKRLIRRTYLTLL